MHGDMFERNFHSSEFDKSFNKVAKAQVAVVIVGSVVSLAIAGGVIWGAIYIANLIWG